MEHKPHLDMLAAREQLMQDINSMVESHHWHAASDDLIKELCDAVCKNFPTPTPD